jgi:hypothetical protein
VPHSSGAASSEGVCCQRIAREGEKVTSLVRTLKNPNVFCDLILPGFTGDLTKQAGCSDSEL